jgi:hypothetical protein
MSNATVEWEMEARNGGDTKTKSQDDNLRVRNSPSLLEGDLSTTVKTQFGRGLIGELMFMADKELTHLEQPDIADMQFQWQLQRLFKPVEQQTRKISLMLYTEYSRDLGYMSNLPNIQNVPVLSTESFF